MSFIEVLPFSIPIIAMLIGLRIALSAFHYRTKRNEMEHQERMLAIEKGVPLPTPPPQAEKSKNPYLWGFILIGFGLAMVIAMIIKGDNDWGWGLIFLLPGIGILAASLLFARQKEKNGGKQNGMTGNSPSL